MSTCKQCGKSTGDDRRRKFCSDKCRKKAWAARNPRVSIELPEAIETPGGHRFRVRLEITATVIGEDVNGDRETTEQ